MRWLKHIFRTSLVRPIVTIVLSALLLWPGCQADVDPGNGGRDEIIFSANGMTIPGTYSLDNPPQVEVSDGDNNFAVTADVVAGSLCLDFAWEPGRKYIVRIGEAPGKDLTVVAPQQPSLAILKVLPLGSDLLSLKIDRTESGPSSAAISPDGAWLAVGSSAGDVSLVSIASGEVKSRLSGFKSYIRSLAISRLGGDIFLYVGEQSPKGTLSVYRTGSNSEIEKIWDYDASRDIGEGVRNMDDPYSWAHQPGIYRILPASDGALFVLATHSDYRDGERLTSSVMYKFENASGKLLWKWPKNKPLDAVATWLAINKDWHYAALCAYSKSGEGEVSVIDCANGETVGSRNFEPLLPHLKQVNFWRSVALTPDGRTAAVLSDDGRAWIWDWAEDKLKDIELGKAILMGNVPLLISGAGVIAGNSNVIFISGVTYLPWDLAEGLDPHQPHPAAQRIFGYSREGIGKWDVPMPNLVQGSGVDAKESWLFAGYSSDPDFAPGGGSGLVVIDLKGDRPVIAASYSVEGGVLHGTPVISDDGKTVVLIEVTQLDDSGENRTGQNRIHILRW